jgi:hypothetical protein
MGQDMDETTVEAPSRRTPLLLGAVALAAVVAGLLGYFVVVPMFAADTATETYVSKGRNVVAASPTPSPSATTLRSYRSATLHDPFKPLAVEDSSGGSSSGSGQSGTGSATAPPPTAPGGATTVAPTRVGVVEITKDAKGAAVMVRLDTAIHIATAGETIADVLKVVSITSKTATFLYGDASFTLSVGQDKVLS